MNGLYNKNTVCFHYKKHTVCLSIYKKIPISTNTLMNLPSDLFGLVKQFVMLPRYLFLIKKDFYKQLSHARLNQLVGMTKILGLTTIKVHPNTIISITRFIASKRPILEIVDRLRTIIFSTCGNNTILYFKLGNLFTDCFLRNMFNWNSHYEIGDVCTLYKYPVIIGSTEYILERKCIVSGILLLGLRVDLYDYIVVQNENNRIVTIIWTSTTSPYADVYSPNDIEHHKQQPLTEEVTTFLEHGFLVML